MKRIISVLALVLAMTMVMSVSAFATAEFSVAEEDIPAAITALEAGADRIDLTVTTTPNADYSILLVAGDTLPTVDSAIAYINQANATTTSLDFDVLPKLTSCDEEMTLYIGTNATGENLISVPVTYAEPAPTNDYITSADTSKGTIKIDVATVNSAGMGLANGKAIVSLALDTTAYPNAGAETAGYVASVVDADGAAVADAIVLYSAERKKYVAAIPATVTDYKFEITEDGTANDVIVMYADFTSDKVVNMADYMQFGLVYKDKALSGSVKNALIADLTGDGMVNMADYMQFALKYKDKSPNFPVLTK